MKKILFTLMGVAFTLSAAADEGMWLLPYIHKMNIEKMQEYGCRLSAQEIYSPEGASLKDAVVIFGRGCTGEIVSPDGLLFTNHHCGYSSIQQLSSVEHDYLKYGFWAKNRDEEIPVSGLTVRFVRAIEDVTPQILGSVPNIAGAAERKMRVEENIQRVIDEWRTANRDKESGREVLIKEFFGGNRYFLFVVEEFRDIRFVGAPPTAIGKFGGDTDNWQYPRHTCDFSVFRVYADKDNRPADYSPENRPYRAETFLKISKRGYSENDFAMIMGFPGTTQRYMTSYEIDRMLEVQNPQRIFIRGERQAILREAMAASDEVRIKYAAKYAQSSNYWKNSIGMSRGIEALGVKADKEAQEESFRRWAAEKSLPEEGYMTALDDIRDAVAELTPLQRTQQYIEEAFLRAVEVLTPARYVSYGGDARREALEKFYKNYDVTTDRRVAKRMFAIAKENMTELPDIFQKIESQFGGDTDAFVDRLYDNTIFADAERVMAMSDRKFKKAAEGDAAVETFNSIRRLYTALRKAQHKANLQFDDAHRRYIAGLMMQNPDKAWSSDANFTIRMTYGRVLPYEPRDGVKYNHFTTLRGVIEKEDATNPTDFTVPQRLKKLYYGGDYADYADADGTLHTCFLADCDITGGNSGSPVLNSRGELIGLAFDGNWEAMSGDVAFSPRYQRTISVDVRYVLFIIDKYGGAGWLLDELTIL